MSETLNLTQLKEQLLKSNWPKCNTLASDIAFINTDEAKDALIEALKAKRHHIRTAAIKNLVRFNDTSLVSAIDRLLIVRLHLLRSILVPQWSNKKS